MTDRVADCCSVADFDPILAISALEALREGVYSKNAATICNTATPPAFLSEKQGCVADSPVCHPAVGHLDAAIAHLADARTNMLSQDPRDQHRAALLAAALKELWLARRELTTPGLEGVA